MRYLTCLLIGLGWCQAAVASEPWADPDLKVTSGLSLWLDAARQPAAWRARQRPSLPDGVRLDTWYDASGNGRHFHQPVQEAQPRVRLRGTDLVLDFDGKDDFLERQQDGTVTRGFSWFCLAAPRSNAGYFRSFFAGRATGLNDYTSGLTIDLGGAGTPGFSTLCPEGFGFGGSVSLMKSVFPWGEFHLIEVHSAPKGEPGAGVQLVIDGQVQGRRDRTSELLRLDHLTVGARCYSNSAEPPFVSGFLDGQIATLLLYDRVLSAAEREEVADYLRSHQQQLNAAAPADTKPLIPVKDPPRVQVLDGGFQVDELGVNLTNINDLQYESQGRLLALGYDGRIHRLTDTNDDGLEDHAEVVWDQPTLQGPLAMVVAKDGLYVTAKQKLVRLEDSDQDGIFDREVIVVRDWEPPWNYSGGVDGLGMARDAEGNLFFALGTSDYANGYLLKDGASHYRRDTQRGSIQKLSPDGRRETWCQGVRFGISLAFNEHGDLFCTDQEGATWLPNGNPFDELLHLQAGRFYGFPPRHPEYLPDVVDEPSVYDYGPQHQSTCGLCFNLPVFGGPTFGPESWRGNAFVAGYSRGKLYRTQLVKTGQGYVAKNVLFACLSELTADVCLSPRGDLVVATHSGGPDWGSGPKGQGHLYRIRQMPQPPARPVMAWQADPREFRVTFDRPLAADELRQISSTLDLTSGEFVRAGDRFESFRPGYDIVRIQTASPRRHVPVLTTSVTPDRQTLLIAVPPQSIRHWTSITFDRAAPSKVGGIPQHPAVEVDVEPQGMLAEWKASGDTASVTTWLPHGDLAVARALTHDSPLHREFWSRLREPGTLLLTGQLDLASMLQPAIQPGSKLDYDPSPEKLVLQWEASAPFELNWGGQPVPSRPVDQRFVATVTVTVEPKRLYPYELRIDTSPRPVELSVLWSSSLDSQLRVFPVRRFLQPWITIEPPGVTSPAAPRAIPELAGGSWGKGYRLFHSSEAQCSKCHTIYGSGGKIGPDLSNLIHRDYASVLRDITNPSFALHPDHLSYTVQLEDGRVLTGTVRNEGDEVLVSDGEARVTRLRSSEIETLEPSAISIMPQGIPDKLGQERLRDLLTFLLLPPPRMPNYGPLEPPPPRSRQEVLDLLAGAPESVDRSRTLRLVLVAGAKDHGEGEHDYPAWLEQWSQLLAAGENIAVATAMEWPAAEQIAQADVMLFFQKGAWNRERAEQIDEYLRRGGGLIYLHWAVEAGPEAPAFAQRIGLASDGSRLKFRHGPLELGFDSPEDHPVARNFDRLKLVDESYWQMQGDSTRIRVLAHGIEDGKPQPLFWTLQPSQGRVLVSIPGHYAWTFDDAAFRLLLMRGICWCADEPVDRLNDLVWPGARVK